MGDGFDFDRAVLEVNAVPGQRSRGDGVDAHQAGQRREDIQGALVIIGQVEARHQVVSGGANALLVVVDHVVHRIEPSSVGSGRTPPFDVVGHGCLNLVDRDGGLRIECPRLENRVHQIGIPVDEPVAEFPVVQHMVEQVAVHVR